MRFRLFFLSCLLFQSCVFQADLESRITEVHELPINGSTLFASETHIPENLKIEAPQVLDYSIAGERMIGVMIENSRISRQGMRGLSQAKVVYEVLAEGGITRFLALFPDSVSNLRVGPIRSARDYFLDWVEEHGIPFVHVGGSPSALERLHFSSKVLDIDDTDLEPFFRDPRYVKPHDAFIELKKVFTMDSDGDFKNKKSFVFTGEPVETRLIASLPKNKGLFIDFWDAPYEVEYKYDEEQKKYLRWNGGVVHRDTINGKQVAVDNIILQILSYEVIDDKLRLKMDTKSSGACVYLVQGTHQTCEWRYENGQTRYFIDEKEIQFYHGNLWIEVVKDESVFEVYKVQ